MAPESTSRWTSGPGERTRAPEAGGFRGAHTRDENRDPPTLRGAAGWVSKGPRRVLNGPLRPRRPGRCGRSRPPGTRRWRGGAGARGRGGPAESRGGGGGDLRVPDASSLGLRPPRACRATRTRARTGFAPRRSRPSALKASGFGFPATARGFGSTRVAASFRGRGAGRTCRGCPRARPASASCSPAGGRWPSPGSFAECPLTVCPPRGLCGQAVQGNVLEITLCRKHIGRRENIPSPWTSTGLCWKPLTSQEL